MNMIQIFVILVLAAVAVLLARIALRLHECSRREERQLDASAHTVSRLISRRVRLNQMLGSGLL
ncbi:MAG: hypothetical protein IJV19_07430 [Prevotella sp.]|nr:hypothetical protein [Prevotella sp.]